MAETQTKQGPQPVGKKIQKGKQTWIQSKIVVQRQAGVKRSNGPVSTGREIIQKTTDRIQNGNSQASGKAVRQVIRGKM